MSRVETQKAIARNDQRLSKQNNRGPLGTRLNAPDRLMKPVADKRRAFSVDSARAAVPARGLTPVGCGNSPVPHRSQLHFAKVKFNDSFHCFK